MAQNPLNPPDSGKIGMPQTYPGMNKLPPSKAMAGGKGAKDDTDSLLTGMTDEEVGEIMTRVRKRMERCIQAESENERDAMQDLRFKAGEQWPADVSAQRAVDKRPCLTVNRLPTLVHQITGAMRENRPSIDVSPIGDRGDVEVAHMLKGLIREIERESKAEEAYDTGAESAVSNGYGYWRVETEYEHPDSFDQVVRIKRVRNPFTVYLDPDCQDSIGADAKFAFVTHLIPKDEFKLLYPDADPLNFEQASSGDQFKQWVVADQIRIAEYFEMTMEERVLLALSNGSTVWEDELSDDVKDMLGDGRLEVMKERRSLVPSIQWYKVNAIQILEATEWVGDWIPIIRIPGDEIDIKGKVKFYGIIRFARDSQMMYNYWLTLMTELVALAPKAPYIGAEGQFEGFEDQWKRANTDSFPYLQYRPQALGGHVVPPPQRQPAVPVPEGVVMAANIAAQDMMATSGVRFDSSMHERLADESGKAIGELRRNTDIGAFHFADNLGRALQHTGEILIDLIQKLYDVRRAATILRQDDTEEIVDIDPNAPKAVTETRMANGKLRRIFNPTIGRYGVTVTIGPSYATRRIEAANSMMEFARAFPQTAPLISDLIARTMDWEDADEIAKRLAKALPPNLMTPEKDVPPQAQALMQAMQQQIQQMDQQIKGLSQALTEKQSDRALQAQKQEQDFEAKLIKVIADSESKAAQTHEKAVSNFNAHIGSQIKDLGEKVTALVHSLPVGGGSEAPQP